MADAKARAAARRQAILAGKSDRLAKLTTKAKNEGDAAAAVRDPTDDPPLAELPVTGVDIPSHSTGTRLSAQDTSQWGYRAINRSSSLTPEPSSWDAQQQENFMRALMATPSHEEYSQRIGISPSFTDRASSPFPMPEVFPPPVMAQRPKTLLEKLLPFLHVTSTMLFLWFFVVPKRALVLDTQNNIRQDSSYWNRWADLWTNSPTYGWSNDYTHVLWSFLSLQACLHSLRIFTQSSPPSVPMLIELVLPHLPPSLTVTITTGFRYMQMVGLLLDDFSLLLVGVAAVIFYSSWIRDVA